MMEVLFWIAVIPASILASVIVVAFVYFYWLEKWFMYRKAKKEIFNYARKYKDRCTGGANRFVVTVDELQGIFIEYDTEVINKVWLDLIDQRIVEQDPLDKTWCIR